MRQPLTGFIKMRIIEKKELMNMGYADLHIHSKYSDGSLSPEEIVRIAKASNVSLISICDHNLVQGTLEVLPIAEAAGIRAVPGCEIDGIFEGLDLHILAYNADFADENLLRRIRHARKTLDDMSTDLLLRMMKDYPALSLEDYDAFRHDFTKGGWKMLQYLRHKRITPDLKSGFPLYDQYGVTYAQAGFDAAEDIVSAVHQAGGAAILAHPGVVFPSERLDVFEKWVRHALELGLDGIECHYPRHPGGMVRRLIDICDEKKLIVTAGSDCHGAFNSNRIGQTKTVLDPRTLL